MTDAAKRVRAAFFRTGEGAEPVRAWLRSLPKEDRQLIGADIRRLELGWPMGMPICRSLGGGLWEVRTKLQNREARVIFFFEGADIWS